MMRRGYVMRTLFSLLLSIIMAVTLCLLLTATGVLKFNGNSAVTQIKPAVEGSYSGARNVLDEFPSLNEIVSQRLRQETPPVTPAAEQVDPAMWNVSDNNEKEMQTTIDPEAEIHRKSLQFLRSAAVEGLPGVEDRFEEFLTGELGLDQKTAARRVKMGFWKNFVTLQHPWRTKDRNEMRIAFVREKELKQTGFAARGLVLMKDQLQEAKLSVMQPDQQTLDAAAAGEGL